MGLVGVDGIFGLGDYIFTGLYDDNPILVLKLGLFYLEHQFVQDM